MSEKTHTPGPWLTRTGFDDETVEVFAPNPEIKPPFKPTELAVVRLPYGDDYDADQSERDANARLIAAAPQMLEALESASAILSVICKTAPSLHEDLCLIDAAIAAATGDQR